MPSLYIYGVDWDKGREVVAHGRRRESGCLPFHVGLRGKAGEVLAQWLYVVLLCGVYKEGGHEIFGKFMH